MLIESGQIQLKGDSVLNSIELQYFSLQKFDMLSTLNYEKLKVQTILQRYAIKRVTIYFILR